MAYASSSNCPFCKAKILGLSPESHEQAVARMNYHYTSHVAVCTKNPANQVPEPVNK